MLKIRIILTMLLLFFVWHWQNFNIAFGLLCLATICTEISVLQLVAYRKAIVSVDEELGELLDALKEFNKKG